MEMHVNMRVDSLTSDVEMNLGGSRMKGAVGGPPPLLSLNTTTSISVGKATNGLNSGNICYTQHTHTQTLSLTLY